jgi:hypothetical protein
MRIKEWLDSKGKTPEWLADALSPPVDPRTVRRWLVGTARPRDPDHIRQIIMLSEGSVTASDILFRPAPKRPPGRPRQVAA